MCSKMLIDEWIILYVKKKKKHHYLNVMKLMTMMIITIHESTTLDKTPFTTCISTSKQAK